MAIITIARQYGSGGRFVGQEVARLLRADYVDKEIIRLAAQRAGVAEEVVAQRDERPITRGERIARMIQTFLESSAATGSAGDPFLGTTGADILLSRTYGESTTPSPDVDDKRYFELISGVIKDLAQTGNIVILGRGGNMILKDVPRVLRALVIAPFEIRLRRVMEREHLNATEATKLINQMDANRAAFTKQFFKVERTDPLNYDLVLNTAKYSFELAARLITDVARDLEASWNS